MQKNSNSTNAENSINAEKFRIDSSSVQIASAFYLAKSHNKMQKYSINVHLIPVIQIIQKNSNKAEKYRKFRKIQKMLKNSENILKFRKMQENSESIAALF
jgi:hypothetical protein